MSRKRSSLSTLREIKQEVVKFAALVFGGVVAVILGIALYLIATDDTEETRRAYADQSVVDITAKWDEQAVWQRASPRFEQALIRERKLLNRFDRYRELGKYRSHWWTTMVELHKRSAMYAGEVRFEHGTATIVMTVVSEAGGWKIESMEIGGSREK
ncbi:hypothetical protein [Luteolibacter sp. LG18]|uniref:hypothetical protein n=1 Tax=Luteolibacter sp. LG18 TaxID=2819286 RepID=UPI002B27DE2F|nr:hypothetical protein llg_24680 [Luteolibacter sp. LG18]